MHEPIQMRDIVASVLDGPGGWESVSKALVGARVLLRVEAVQTDDGGDDDLAGLLAVQHPLRTTVATLVPGECALALDIVELAIKASCAKWNSEDRRGARAWLRNTTPIYPARLCFEALGIDYDAARDVLEKRWKEQG